jgi:hypothetical protein
MPWYDVVFFAAVGGAIFLALFRTFRPKLSEDARAYDTEMRARRREALALTFSPAERPWVALYGLLVILFVIYLLVRA